MIIWNHFCFEHILMLITIFMVMSICIFYARKSSAATFKNISRMLAAALFLGEALLDVFLFIDGRDVLSFLPLHLCNLGIFVNLFAAFTKGRIQAFFAEVSLVLIMPGSLGALLFPDWTYKPFWSYIPLMCFITHSLLVLIPVLFLAAGKIHVSFAHFWYSYAFLLFAVPIVYFVNLLTEMNYMYLRFPPEDSPLEWIFRLTGERYYPAGLVLLLTSVLLLEYPAYWAAGKIQKKK